MKRELQLSIRAFRATLRRRSYALRTGRDYVWLSLGENCLPDDVLKRHGRKSFSTPYSSGRGNVEYAIQLERNSYHGLLEPSSLVYTLAGGKQVVRSIRYASCSPIYEESCSNGFEFTHHDVIASAAHRQSYARKVQRMLALRGSLDVVFLYHHRSCENSDIPLLRNKLIEFATIYKRNGVHAMVVLFRPTLRELNGPRKLELRYSSPELMDFEFFTDALWAGDDDEIFWARRDDDLLGHMLAQAEASILRSWTAEASNAWVGSGRK